MTIVPQPERLPVPRTRVVTAPVVAAVTVGEAKSYCRIDHNQDDAVLLPLLIGAATALVEAFCRDHVFASRTLESAYASQPSGNAPIELPYRPVSSITSITTYDDNGVGTVLDSGDYTLDSGGAIPLIQLDAGVSSWPQGTRTYDPLVVRYVAGYGATEAAVPDHAKLAVLVAVAAWYDERVPGPLPAGSMQALAPLVGYRLRG